MYSLTEGSVDHRYLTLLGSVYWQGEEIQTRNSLCKRLVAFSTHFTSTPLVSIRKTAWRLALREMEWFLSGSENIKDLHPSVRHWWQPWANKRGEVPNNYSKQFRRFSGDPNADGLLDVDQVAYLIEGVKKHPNSRRNLLTTWNTAEMVDPSTPITNCHNTVTQAFVEKGKLRLVTYQRSADLLCGLPANWIQEWALLLWLAHRTGKEVGGLTWIGGDCHLYKQHWELTGRMVSNAFDCGATPELVYAPTSEDFKADDFSLSGEYKPQYTDKAEMVV